MKITTLTSPFLLRQYLCADDDLRALLVTEDVCKIFPINAPMGTEGEFITFTATGYEKEYVSAVNYNEVRTVEVECASPDYDTALLTMIEAVRKVVIKMRNDGHDVHITDSDEYKYSFVEGGADWNVERVTITLNNIAADINLTD